MLSRHNSKNYRCQHWNNVLAISLVCIGCYYCDKGQFLFIVPSQTTLTSPRQQIEKTFINAIKVLLNSIRSVNATKNICIINIKVQVTSIPLTFKGVTYSFRGVHF